MLLEAILDDNNNDIPYLFVSKIDDFNNEKNEYDYSYNDDTYNKILIIPTNYYSLNKPGFYLHYFCNNICEDFIIKITTINEIDLNLNKKISYYSKQEENEFIINIKDNNNKIETAYILNSVNIKAIRMEIDSNIARESLSNVLSFTSTNLIGKVNIFNYDKNIYFNFRTHIIKDIHNINELENSQYFIINKETVFNIKINNDNLNSQKRRISIISHKNCLISINCTNKIFNSLISLREGETENISEEIFCEKPNKIIITPNETDEYQVVRIIIEKKINSNKISEPLTPDIYQNYNLYGINNENKKIYTYDHSIFYKENNEEINEYKGIQFDIQIKTGELRIYRALCIAYPFCKDNKNLTELFPLSGYVSEIFYASETLSPMSNHRNIIIIECLVNKNNNNICEYNIGYHKIDEYKKLNKYQVLIKYLEYSTKSKDNIKEDKYSIILHNNISTILDLIVYSGDAFILSEDPKFIDYNCIEKIYHLGSNERWVLYCNGINDNYFEYKIKIQANEYGAIYQIYSQDIEDNNIEEVFPIGMTMMNYLKNNTNIKNITIRNSNSNKDYPFMTMYNPINCDLKLKNNLESNYIISDGQNVIMDINYTNKSITYSIEKYNQTHSEEKTCLFLISSNYFNGNISYFILPESKPFRVILYSERKSSKIIFPYASNNSEPRILLRVTVFNQYPIFLSIKLCSGEEKSYSIFQSKNILIGNGTKIKPHKICPILINLYSKSSEEEQIIIDLNIKASTSIPYSIKTEEFFSDVVKKNRIQYYVAIINQYSKGSLLLNFRRGSGMVYAKIFEFNQKRENNGWNRRFILPKNDSLDLLKYNFNEQKLYFNENNTKNCEKFCYLIFGIEPYQMDRELIESKYITIFYDYSLFLRYFNKDENFINFIDIQSDEFIIGNINSDDNNNDYFEFHFQNRPNINTLIIDFQSENCRLVLAFNSFGFNDNEKIKIFEGNYKNQIFKINKKEFISYYDNLGKDLDYLTINIKVEINKEREKHSKINSDYKFRLKASIDILENIITADTSIPVYCSDYLVQKENDTSYCEYIININEFEYYEKIELYSSAEKKENLSIYAKLVETNDFINSINKGILVPWPDKNLCKDNEKHSNILIKNLNETKSFKLLIRIYLNGNSYVELYTNLIRSKNMLLPFPKYPQILSADKSGIRIKFPEDDDYNVHFTTLEGKGQFIFNEKTFTLFGNYDTLIFNTKKTLKENNITLCSMSYNNSKNITDKNYSFKIRYSKMKENLPLEQIILNSGGDYIYTDKNRRRFYYYISINKKIKETIPFNLIFKELNNNDKEFRDKNASELFNINGYLINKNKFLDLQLKDKIDYNLLGHEYSGNYDLSHHQVNIFFIKKEINSFYEKNNEEFYIFIIVEKAKENEREYSFIHSSITAFLANQEKRIAPIDSYLTNHFEKNTNNTSHLYKLNSLSEAKEMVLEFSSPNKDIKFKIINSFNNNSKINEINLNEFFNIKRLKSQEEIGKDIIVLKKNLDKVILLVECKNHPKQNLEYTFKYFNGDNYSFVYEYNPNIKKDKHNNNYDFTFSKIKYKKNYNNSQDLVKCNYYLRIFEMKNNSYNTLNDISTFFIEEKPIIIYKISYDDKILEKDKDFIYFQKNNDLKEGFYIDVIAEIIKEGKTYEYLAYNRIDNKIETIWFTTEKLKIICLCVGGVLIIILILIIYICCSKKRNENLINKVKEISAVLGNNSRVTKISDDDVEEEEEDVIF